MWGQQQGSNKKVASEQASKNTESKSSEESWSQPKGKSNNSLYDSGRTDSGFLSGANLSETIVTEDLTPMSPTTSKQDLDKDLSKSYSRLDSGVDVGLSDQLSELCIDESTSETDEKKNIMISQLDLQPDPEPSPQELHNEIHSTQDHISRIPWDYYFQQDEDGDTQLHLAIIERYTEVVYYLIQLVPTSSYLDIRNDLRQTPLHLAVLTGQAKVVRRLVCAGADTRIIDLSGNTPLQIAVANGDFSCVRALTTPVMPSEVQAAHLRYSAPVIPPPVPENYNFEGLTCVHLATLGGHIEILMHLVKDVQANINAKEHKGGRTCLHLACEAGNETLVLALLDLGADHTVKNYAYDTPYAVARYHPDILSLLSARGAFFEVFTDTEEEEDDEVDDLQMYAFRDIHHLNGILNVA